MPDKTYRRLPGTGYHLHLYIKLWLGPDHLLWVESTGFSERYKRFYYSDIQAVVMQRTQRGLLTSVVLGLVTLIPLLIAIGSEGGDRTFWFTIVALLAPWLFLNLLLGPTCRCSLYTAVQHEKLDSLARLRMARKALRLLKGQIEPAQGALSREDLLTRIGRTDVM